MKQYEAVIATIERLGGIATLGQINHKIFQIQDCIWNTKTPYASIRRIVQTNENIYKLRPGLYALTKYRNILEKQGIFPEITAKKHPEKYDAFSHSYYQGLLLEIGNWKGFNTCVPAQDKNRLFIDRPLKTIASLDKLFDFSYPELVNRASNIDVIWFNNRKLISSVFEVEHSTDMHNSLLKYNDLQDFYIEFYIVSNKNRIKEFSEKINYSAFNSIKTRVRFIDYDFVSKLHTKISELRAIGDI
ncbi:MAG: hypothetical protein LBD99_00515 [Candidatus Margulisbacteria bacterium]|jgi:hypothetical protein|nr:hypothetical protein [Candidatus Margulisiibacteriota bacterium]